MRFYLLNIKHEPFLVFLVQLLEKLLSVLNAYLVIVFHESLVAHHCLVNVFLKRNHAESELEIKFA